jgi:BlaI family penicillinase repressor
LNIVKISNAEREVMKIVWNKDEEVTAADIIKELGDKNKWKLTTVLTLANRLVEKNVLKVRKEKRVNYYSANVSRDEYKSYQANDFIDNVYGGSVKSLIASLYDNKKIDETDIKELKNWLKEVQ